MNEAIKCIGVIMDGNRRWAKERKIPSYKGHLAGYEKIKDLISWSKKRDIKNVIIYAFSTENWGRSEREVAYLLNIFRKAVKEFLVDIGKDDIKITFLGDTDKFPKDLRDGMRDLEEETKNNKSLHLYIALSYGGRSELVSAANKMIKESKKKDLKITEKNFSKYLFVENMPDPDIIIRTGGEMRLSNFLLWQAAYSELFFTKTYWPDFSEKEFEKIIMDFLEREIRRGK